MNKQILSIFVFCAFSYSTQAQEVKGGISDSMTNQAELCKHSHRQGYPQRHRQQRHP